MKTSTEGIAELCFLVFICVWCFMGCELSVHQSDGLEEISACGRKEPSIPLNFISQIKELIHIAEREKTSSADLSVYSTAYKIAQCLRKSDVLPKHYPLQLKSFNVFDLYSLTLSNI